MQNLGNWARLLAPGRWDEMSQSSWHLLRETDTWTDLLQYNISRELTKGQGNAIEAQRKEWLISIEREGDIPVGLKGKEFAKWRVGRWYSK